MIRPATSDDLATLTQFGLRFMEHHPLALPGRGDALAEVLAHLMAHGFLWVAEADGQIVGTLAAAEHHFWFDPGSGVSVVAELGWWIEKDYRQSGLGLRLLRKLESWAEEVGAAGVVLSDLVAADGTNTIGDLAERMGYSVVERSHFKGNARWQQSQR